MLVKSKPTYLPHGQLFFNRIDILVQITYSPKYQRICRSVLCQVKLHSRILDTDNRHWDQKEVCRRLGEKKRRLCLEENYFQERIVETKSQFVGIKAHYSSNKTNILFINKTKLTLQDPLNRQQTSIYTLFSALHRPWHLITFIFLYAL